MPDETISLRKKRQKRTPSPTKTELRIERAQTEIQHAGLSFDHKHHLFIAKLKRGEVWALNQLSLRAKTTITPLLEMWPPKPEIKKPPKTLAQHTSDLMGKLSAEWTGLPCFLDTQYLQAGMAPSPASAKTVFGIARTMNVKATPVTSPFFSPPFQDVIRDVIAVDGLGVMLRLPIDFFEEPQKLGVYLSGLVKYLKAKKSEVDILVDLQHRPSLVDVQEVGAYCIGSLPFINEWRTVTLASGCFPDSISGQPTGQWVQFPRTDWQGWTTVAKQRAASHLRVPTYGDYAVRCGGMPQYVPNLPAPNVRYSDNQTIWVERGLKNDPHAMAKICASLVTQTYFSGPAFSQGDAHLAKKAAMPASTNGTPEQWIQWCTNHHLELTSSQILNLPLP